MRTRSWNLKQLEKAVKESRSLRQVLSRLGLVEAGGNYEQVKKYIKESNVNIDHFTGSAWAKGQHISRKPNIPLEKILVKDSSYQSFKLKRRLFDAKIKTPFCEECGWAKQSVDGRIPLELDHINGNRNDNRLENLRILCPNCHSLKPTHRGRNRKRKI